jgi:hypothetical protein
MSRRPDAASGAGRDSADPAAFAGWVDGVVLNPIEQIRDRHDPGLSLVDDDERSDLGDRASGSRPCGPTCRFDRYHAQRHEVGDQHLLVALPRWRPVRDRGRRAHDHLGPSFTNR